MFVLQLLICVQALIEVVSFSVAPAGRTRSFAACVSPSQTLARNGVRLFGSKKEEEIAKLEAQLRQLREDENLAETSSIETEDDTLSVKEFEIARRRLEKMKGKDMLLTEQDLISGGLMDAEGLGISGGVFGIVAAVVAVVFLLLFSQVPVGQENLARYSATGSSIIKSIDLGDLNPDANRL